MPCDLQVAAGLAHCLALSQDGKLFAWGWNSAGQLGLGNASLHQDVTPLPTFVGHVQHPWERTVLAAGRVHSMAATPHLACSRAQEHLNIDAGNVYVWGSGRNGRLGLGSQQSFGAPQLVDFDGCGKVSDIACGCDHTLILLQSSP